MEDEGACEDGFLRGGYRRLSGCEGFRGGSCGATMALAFSFGLGVMVTDGGTT